MPFTGISCIDQLPLYYGMVLWYRLSFIFVDQHDETIGPEFIYIRDPHMEPISCKASVNMHKMNSRVT